MTEEEQDGAGRDEHGDGVEDAEVGGLRGAELGGELLHGGPKGDLERALGRRRPETLLKSGVEGGCASEDTRKCVGLRRGGRARALSSSEIACDGLGSGRGSCCSQRWSAAQSDGIASGIRAAGREFLRVRTRVAPFMSIVKWSSPTYTPWGGRGRAGWVAGRRRAGRRVVPR